MNKSQPLVEIGVMIIKEGKVLLLKRNIKRKEAPVERGRGCGKWKISNHF